jgi:hypothetical protein
MTSGLSGLCQKPPKPKTKVVRENCEIDGYIRRQFEHQNGIVTVEHATAVAKMAASIAFCQGKKP